MRKFTNFMWNLMLVFAVFVSAFTWGIYKDWIHLESIVSYLVSLQR